MPCNNVLQIFSPTIIYNHPLAPVFSLRPCPRDQRTLERLDKPTPKKKYTVLSVGHCVTNLHRLPQEGQNSLSHILPCISTTINSLTNSKLLDLKKIYFSQGLINWNIDALSISSKNESFSKIFLLCRLRIYSNH